MEKCNFCGLPATRYYTHNISWDSNNIVTFFARCEEHRWDLSKILGMSNSLNEISLEEYVVINVMEN